MFWGGREERALSAVDLVWVVGGKGEGEVLSGG